MRLCWLHQNGKRAICWVRTCNQPFNYNKFIVSESNAFSVLFRLRSDIVTRLTEGQRSDKAKYITGTRQTPMTARRVTIYETEGSEYFMLLRTQLYCSINRHKHIFQSCQLSCHFGRVCFSICSSNFLVATTLLLDSFFVMLFVGLSDYHIFSYFRL